MRQERAPAYTRWLPVAVLAAVLLAWGIASKLGAFAGYSVFPSLPAVITGFGEEMRGMRLFNNAVISLYRVSWGFMLAVALSLPLGLWMGHHLAARAALLPAVNFFRNLSPLAWISFAILWFRIGDPPAIFLIFLSSFFPLAVAVVAAVASIPQIHFQVGRDYGLKGGELFWQVTLPAILPQFITALRVTIGVAWMVVVAAEMISGTSGLGFAVWDSRNGLRTDLLVVQMIVIGLIGVGLDRLLMQLTRLRSVRWGYDR